MSLPIVIVDPDSSVSARVSKNRAVIVSQEIPDVKKPTEPNRHTLFNALLGTSGAVEGADITDANMNVDGSAASKEFYIGAEPDVDIRIMRIIILIADSAVVHSSFGNIAALANGFDLTVFESGFTTSLLNKVKTGGQAIAHSGIFAPFGDGADSNEILNWTGTEDAQAIVFDVSAVVPGGIRIALTTDDKIFATVNDDLTGLTEFTVRAMGYRHRE